MGNDSGLRKKSKQRTPPHKKHTVYPGMTLSNEVKVEYGSIKPITNKTPTLISTSNAKRKEYDDPLWQAYDRAAQGLSHANNSSKAQNNIPERIYELAYRRLVRAGKAPKIKRKYTA